MSRPRNAINTSPSFGIGETKIVYRRRTPRLRAFPGDSYGIISIDVIGVLLEYNTADRAVQLENYRGMGNGNLFGNRLVRQ